MNALQKQQRIERAKRHAAQDRLIAGHYVDTSGKEWKGCSVGCDLIEIKVQQGMDPRDVSGAGCHAFVADHDGTAAWIEGLRDDIFEGLPECERFWWHITLAKALPVDEKRIARFGTADWNPYYHAVSIAILERVLLNKANWNDPYAEQAESAVFLAIDYHKDPSEEKRAAVISAGKSAWYGTTAACYGARAAACSIDYAEATVYYAVDSARAGYSCDDNDDAEYKAIAEEVIRVMEGQ